MEIIDLRSEYDKDVDAAYIYLEYPIKKGQVKETIELNENIAVDFDKDGKLIGIEILEASKHLNKKSIAQAT